jgi:hypothetical protein
MTKYGTEAEFISATLQAMNKKRRQHHVWQRYLRAWASDGQIQCMMDGRIFPTGTTVVAVQNDFYKIDKLTQADVALIRFLVVDVRGAHALTRKSHERFLSMVLTPSLFEGQSPELDELIDAVNTNALEDYHAGMESMFLPLLDRALAKDIAFYTEPDNCVGFFHFMATQQMRTKGVREKTIAILKEEDGLDASRVWAILSLMLAENIGMTMFLERSKRKLVLIENRTSREFITGDQPIINLHGGEWTAPATVCWYYPISPVLALHLTEVDQEPELTTDGLTVADVDRLNARMVAASHAQVFARSGAALEPYRTIRVD